ncbi:neuropeptide receptor 15-like [Ylistrum balloti]|uniref:neuropeptide receptor 15-like n=1 Tax=Ylistrum balloti TaxID=509963 RepID=UPI002905D225|nr:neuropeptide receptor 15-like [Ylistrum balloti]
MDNKKGTVLSVETCMDCFDVFETPTDTTIFPLYFGNVSGWQKNITPPFKPGERSSSPVLLILLSVLFFVIGVTGICGNALVVFAVMLNRKMRTSMTNLLITNLAFADLVIMILGIPETVQFMMDRGWTLQAVCCKINRYVLVTALYGSVLTLMALCVERYVAIIHPIKAHIVCNKRRIVVILGCIWPCAWAAGLPTLIFNEVRQGHPHIPVLYCMMVFPDNHIFYFKVFKYIESVLFYFMPLLIQIVLYAFITKHLFLGSDRLHRRVTVRQVNGSSMERFSEALQARRGVVKMLMLSVIVYFISYSPNQILLICNTVSPTTFHENFSFQVFTMVIANLNSAANPILYSIFSQNFRQCFRYMMCGLCVRRPKPKPTRQLTLTSNGSRLWRHTSMASAASTEV